MVMLQWWNRVCGVTDVVMLQEWGKACGVKDVGLLQRRSGASGVTDVVMLWWHKSVAICQSVWNTDNIAFPVTNNA